MPRTDAGRALLENYPGLGGMVYGMTAEPIIDAIEREAAAQERAILRAGLIEWSGQQDWTAQEAAIAADVLRGLISALDPDVEPAILAEPSGEPDRCAECGEIIGNRAHTEPFLSGYHDFVLR